MKIWKITENLKTKNNCYCKKPHKTFNLYLLLGANLRTGQQGIFPVAHVVDVDYNDFDPNRSNDDRKERYLLEYLGSVESSLYKGNVVLCQVELNIKDVISFYRIFF